MSLNGHISLSKSLRIWPAKDLPIRQALSIRRAVRPHFCWEFSGEFSINPE